LLAIIKELNSILNSAKKRDEIIREELKEMDEKIGDDRRTEFADIQIANIDREELIKDDPMLITVSRKGFIFREIGKSSVKTSSRGTKGHKGDVTDTDKLEENDFIFATVGGHLKDTILFATDTGRVYSLKGYEIKGAIDGKITRGHIRNIERLEEIEKRGEMITSVILVKEFLEDNYLVFMTRLGKIARIPLNNFDSVYKNGIIGMRLNKNDAVVQTVITDGNQDLFIIKSSGIGYKIAEKQIPVYNRGVGGAKGIGLKKDKEFVIGMQVAEKDTYAVFITTDGRGRKLTPSEFKSRNRGAMGYKIVDTGSTKERVLADFTICEKGDAVLITTKHGRRVSFNESQMRRNVLLKMINLVKGDSVSAISTIAAPEGDK
jgi:DNA gyrase subunit A